MLAARTKFNLPPSLIQLSLSLLRNLDLSNIAAQPSVLSESLQQLCTIVQAATLLILTERPNQIIYRSGCECFEKTKLHLSGKDQV